MGLGWFLFIIFSTHNECSYKETTDDLLTVNYLVIDTADGALVSSSIWTLVGHCPGMPFLSSVLFL